MPTPDDSDVPAGENVDPTVRDLLVSKIDELVANAEKVLDEITTVADQLEPDRASSVGGAVGIASIGLDEVRQRAHAEPLTGRVSEERRLLDRIEDDT